ncbi:Saccharopine dehydrogenase-like oxidoreductase [Staphylotrichum tortipilum]|uniref:Saccharopine dehydrogenase-like oxidoreductase n=1 Tax=Staphylotrichum tortipilum TaxID=2831512 RepID=A0AAN6MJH8_9PEZI|nr:Saccharopine dehydrogenase-like oxidoreductase [Staphylotrichum longicolle]
MASKDHGREYDLVVFGATGYTGKYTAQYITTHLPSTLKWAVAGRSESKLSALVTELSTLNPDRIPPSIELGTLTASSLSALAQKTFILLTTVGPYGALGEHAFAACATHGTHYLDVTGEVPFVAKMLTKYSSTAAKTGALMFPQIGIESAPPDLLTWSLARFNRATYSLPTADVTVSVHTLKSAPSGGTLATVFTILDNFSLAELHASHVPYALSPVPRPAAAPPKPSLWTRLTGLVNIPGLGLLTTSLAGSTDAAQVQRTWGLLSSVPSRKEQGYGPNFSFREYMRPRNWLTGVAIHFGLMVLGLVMATPWLRRVVAKRVYQPGEGPEAEAAKWDEIEYRGVGRADGKEGGALGRAWFLGSTYYLTGILLAEAAATLLQEDVDLPGGVYTPACLGQPFIDRLDRAGFHIEVKPLEP